MLSRGAGSSRDGGDEVPTDLLEAERRELAAAWEDYCRCREIVAYARTRRVMALQLIPEKWRSKAPLPARGGHEW